MWLYGCYLLEDIDLTINMEGSSSRMCHPAWTLSCGQRGTSSTRWRSHKWHIKVSEYIWAFKYLSEEKVRGWSSQCSVETAIPWIRRQTCCKGIYNHYRVVQVSGLSIRLYYIRKRKPNTLGTNFLTAGGTAEKSYGMCIWRSMLLLKLRSISDWRSAMLIEFCCKPSTRTAISAQKRES